MGIKPHNTSPIVYHPPKRRYAHPVGRNIAPMGIDTEADTEGRMFVTCLSDGTIITPDKWPYAMFDRAHRDRPYVAYNLKYDAGALLQHLPAGILDILRSTNRVYYESYTYKVIANKLLSIQKGKHYIVIYDIMQFYGGSLDHNAMTYLGEGKIDIETKRFTLPYIRNNWDEITRYCVRDADLTARLAHRFISQLNDWGMTVTKLYSTAWISYQWFASRCGHPTVKHFWYYNRRVLDYAMAAYNGGKFEVTTKGTSYLYEYDIVSAYPHSIANLLDLHHCGVRWSKHVTDGAAYAFIDCTMDIPLSLPSPVAIKRGGVNTYPAGTIRKTITLAEYNYLTTNGADVTIHDACWIIPDREVYLYRDEILRLVALKQQYKHGDQLAYHTVKILLNSLYGKFVQLIEQSDSTWRAGSSWNPIYGSVITADTRVRISDMQRKYPSVWAVHTDSLISDQPLPYEPSNTLGDMSYEIEGPGVIVGTGIYQIGYHTAIRGVRSNASLYSLRKTHGRYADMSRSQPLSWRQTLQRNMDTDHINRWIDHQKHMRVDMDSKRVWLDDWTSWHEVTQRTVESIPYIYSSLWYS